jgi:hypothetical protein
MQIGDDRTSATDLIPVIKEVLQQDSRILAAWLAGSRGRGTEDEYSDTDVWVVVADDDVAGFVQDWPAISAKITPTVLQQQVGRLPVFNQVTPEWLRFDLSVGTPEQVPERSRSTLRLLFDRADLHDRLKPTGPPLAPDPAAVRHLVTEFLRVLGLLPVVLGREEYVVAASGVGLLRGLLIHLMLQDVSLEDRGGALKLARILPDERLQALTDLRCWRRPREDRS